MEAFPPLSPNAMVDAIVPEDAPRLRRRKGSSLGADPRGDTGAGSLATADLQPASYEATSPLERKNAEKPQRHRKRRKAKKLLSRWKRFSFRHTWVNPLILLSLLLGAYFVRPGEENPLHFAIFLAYENPPLNERVDSLPAHIGPVTQYGKGPLDFAFVAFYALVFTFTREFFMQRLIRPIAIHYGIRSRAKQSRFMEQFYTAMYFSVFGPFGLYVMSRTPVWYFNTAGMYQGYPHRAHEACFKAYYLLQAAYWAQQGLVLLLQLEKPRKDFKELVLHHIITLALIALSYRFHFTYMGLAVYITHDISDFFLATSKSLNYIDSIITIPYFATFIVVWAYMRHYLNLVILVSLLPPSIGQYLQQWFPGSSGIQTGQFVTVGAFELNWETQQYKCWISQIITFGLLACLQAVNMFWFFLIIRILLRILFKGVQKDDRSDDEDETETIEESQLADQGALGTAGEKKPLSQPQVLVNGRPISKLKE